MQYFTDDIRNLLSKSLSTAVVDENRWHNVKEEGGSDEASLFLF